jgi:hypothetical protein
MGNDDQARELIRYTRGVQVRVYTLRSVANGAELWRITESGGQQTGAVKEADVGSMEETLELLEEIQRSLTAGGWREI